MSRKKGSENLSPEKKQEILIAAKINGSISKTAKYYDLSEMTIKNIVKNNMELDKSISEHLAESMIVGAGKVGNLAISALERKNLDEEKASTCSQIAADMSKIIRGDQVQATQINITMPRSRDEILAFLKSDKVIDNPTSNESANVDGDIQEAVIHNNPA